MSAYKIVFGVMIIHRVHIGVTDDFIQESVQERLHEFTLRFHNCTGVHDECVHECLQECLHEFMLSVYRSE